MSFYHAGREMRTPQFWATAAGAAELAGAVDLSAVDVGARREALCGSHRTAEVRSTAPVGLIGWIN
jgi:hypothetical protein